MKNKGTRASSKPRLAPIDTQQSSLHISIRPAFATSPPSSTSLNKMAMSNVISPPSEPPKLSMTSKEWVVPPRPKPGRKPATDTPPSKRKAQNRAAQRAFRERRAARVAELEEQIEELREDHEKIQNELQKRAQGLETELQAFKTRCIMLEEMLERQRIGRARLEAELDSRQKSWQSGDTLASASSASSARSGSIATIGSNTPGAFRMSPENASAVQQSSRTTQRETSNASNVAGGARQNASQPFSISQIISPSEPQAQSSGCGSCAPGVSCACVDELIGDPSLVTGCGKCSVKTRCECLEDALAATQAELQPSKVDLKRPREQSPIVAPDEKRARIEVHNATSSSMYEKVSAETVVVPIPPRDPCGFCSEGTYCMCAEAAATSVVSVLAPTPISSTERVSILGPQTQTPPPSENDAAPSPIEITSTGAVKLPALSTGRRKVTAPPLGTAVPRNPILPVPRPSIRTCGENGPGTCAQCLSDPRSSLFCRSLAANFARQASSLPPFQGGCCGRSRNGGGCCKFNVPVAQQQPKMGLSLSCADAYKTLSTHKNFERASDDIESWLPGLKARSTATATAAAAAAAARPNQGGETNSEGLLPIEVEAASIMSVLKSFDVRFSK